MWDLLFLGMTSKIPKIGENHFTNSSYYIYDNVQLYDINEHFILMLDYITLRGRNEKFIKKSFFIGCINEKPLTYL